MSIGVITALAALASPFLALAGVWLGQRNARTQAQINREDAYRAEVRDCARLLFQTSRAFHDAARAGFSVVRSHMRTAGNQTDGGHPGWMKHPDIDAAMTTLTAAHRNLVDRIEDLSVVAVGASSISEFMELANFPMQLHHAIHVHMGVLPSETNAPEHNSKAGEISELLDKYDQTHKDARLAIQKTFSQTVVQRAYRNNE